jgi:hypothetical protein
VSIKRTCVFSDKQLSFVTNQKPDYEESSLLRLIPFIIIKPAFRQIKPNKEALRIKKLFEQQLSETRATSRPSMNPMFPEAVINLP